jgi:hypothetical protein
MKASFYIAIGSLFDTFRKYHKKILLRDFNAEVGRENILKPTGSESWHEVSNDNGVPAVNCATLKKSDTQKYNVPTS